MTQPDQSQLDHSDELAASGISRAYANYALWLLTAINLMNYLTRNAIFAVFDPVKRDLNITDAHLGWLGTAYVLVFSLASLPAGVIGDLGSRRMVIAAGVALWSLGTVLSGLAQDFMWLLLARSLVGLGGAAAATASAAMVADYFPGKRRSTAMSIFMAGLAVGGVFGILLAGQLEHRYGWRVAFLTLGMPGFVLAILVARIKDPTRPFTAAKQGADALLRVFRELSGAARRIMSTRTLVAVFAGGALISFGMNGLVGWAPTFISRELELTPARASVLLGTWGLAFGIAGTVAGGLVADWLRTRVQGARLITTAVGFFVGSPLLLWLLYIRDMDLFIPVFCAAFFFLTWYNGPLTAVIFDVTPRRIATTVSGAYLMFIHLAGDAVAFPLVGWLSDNYGLEKAIIALPVAAVIGAAIVLSAVKALADDTARAAA